MLDGVRRGAEGRCCCCCLRSVVMGWRSLMKCASAPLAEPPRGLGIEFHEEKPEEKPVVGV